MTNWLPFMFFLFQSLSWSLTQPRFRLVSWNLLAPIYARRDKYPWVSPNALDWDTFRQDLIVKKLKELNSDIICLQEVEIDRWNGLKNCFDDYEGVLQQTNNHPVATAILVRKSSKLYISTTESRSRALIAVLKHEKLPPLFVANVHLDAGRTNDQTRRFQLISLLKRLARNMEMEKVPNDSEAPLLIAGDMNVLKNTNIYKLLAEGSLPTDTTVSHHLLPLEDAYRDTTSLRFTHGCGSVLDYIWTSKSIHMIRTVTDDVPYNTVQMPSATHPSDHWPIGIDFTHSTKKTTTIISLLRQFWKSLL